MCKQVKVYTYGYQGNHPEQLLTITKEIDAIVLDVRYSPFSRVEPWRKARLEETFGDRYYFTFALGNVNYKSVGDSEPVVLKDKAAGFKSMLNVLAHGGIQGRPGGIPKSVILLCYERKPEECHRKEIADWFNLEHPEYPVRHIVHNRIPEETKQSSLF